MPSLPMDQHNSHPAFKAPRRRRAARVVIGVAGVLFGMVAGRDMWLPRTVSWAVPQHLHMTVQGMETSLFPPALRIHGLHLADTTAGWNVRIRELNASGIAWQSGRLHVHQLEMDSAMCSADVSPGAEPQDDLWLDVGVDELRWNHLHVATAEDTMSWDNGMALGLILQPHRRQVDQLGWGACQWKSSSLPQNLVLGPSSLSVQDDVEGWRVASDAVRLPGIQFSGSLGWPLRETHGQAEVNWQQVPPWMLQFAGLGGLEPCWNGVDSPPSTLTWTMTPDSWELAGQGPCGLTLEAGGSVSAWSAQAHVNQLPPDWKDMAGIDMCSVNIEGQDSTFTWSADALPALATTGEGHVNWPSMHLELKASISTLGRFVQHPQEALTAALSWGDALDWELAQPRALHPWRLSGKAGQEETTFNLDPTWPTDDRVHGKVTWPQNDTPAYQLQAHLGEGQRRLDARASLAPDRGELTLDIHAPHTQAELTTDVTQMDWRSWWSSVATRHQTTWPTLQASGALTPESPCWAWLGKDASAHVTWDVESTLHHMHAAVQSDSVRWNGKSQGNWSLEAIGRPENWRVDVHGQSPSNSLQAVLMAEADWDLNVEGANIAAGTWNTSLKASQEAEGWDMRLDEAAWTWPDLAPDAPALSLDEPVDWTASGQRMWPPQVNLVGALGEVVVVPASDDVAFHCSFGEDALQWLEASLGLRAKALSCQARWLENALALDLSLDRARWNSIDLAKAEVAATWTDQTVMWSLRGSDSTDVALLDARGHTSLLHPELLRARLALNGAPATWGQAWVPETWLSFDGRVSGQMGMGGSISRPSLQGALALDSVRLTVPNMGTWFEVNGPLRILPDAWLVDQAQVRDALENQATWTAALYHEAFRDVNVDVHAFDMSGPMRILDLPKDIDLPFSGVLDADGEASMFFWNDQFTVSGDARILGASDCQISLVSEDEARWEDLVTFVNPAETDSTSEVELKGPAQGITLSLDLNIDPVAKATLVTDRDNSVKMGGRTEGALSLVLENWERLTLAGGLEIVEGDCEFVLGPFLSKEFALQPGGMLTWDGDPYAGQIDVEALHTLRANVTPLVGEINGQGRRMEDVQVSLLLDGDMLQPDIDFALGAPDAENVVQSAMASVLVDDAERTAQAIALLSLQEFLPNQFNSLSLGTEGLQSNSVDMLTSQVSRWLSNLNDDVEIGLSYDAAGALLTEEESQQDALQLAMKAAFLDNRLHVEGEVGSNPTLESLGGANLQEVRVMYELNPEKGLQLVGFSENRTTQGQIGSQSTQGVGIRWHRSFNWIWPWQRPKSDGNQPKEEGSTSS